jgi:hypothetical protein
MSVVADDASKFEKTRTYSCLFLSGTLAGHADLGFERRRQRPTRRWRVSLDLCGHSCCTMSSQEPAASSIRAADGAASKKLANPLSTLDFRPPLSSFILVSVPSCFAAPANYCHCYVDQPQSLSTQPYDYHPCALVFARTADEAWKAPI